jgi:hypothetical protein
MDSSVIMSDVARAIFDDLLTIYPLNESYAKMILQSAKHMATARSHDVIGGDDLLLTIWTEHKIADKWWPYAKEYAKWGYSASNPGTIEDIKNDLSSTFQCLQEYSSSGEHKIEKHIWLQLAALHASLGAALSDTRPIIWLNATITSKDGDES